MVGRWLVKRGRKDEDEDDLGRERERGREDEHDNENEHDLGKEALIPPLRISRIKLRMDRELVQYSVCCE